PRPCKGRSGGPVNDPFRVGMHATRSPGLRPGMTEPAFQAEDTERARNTRPRNSRGFLPTHSQLTRTRTLRTIPPRPAAGPGGRADPSGTRMSVRSWLIRGLILAGVAALVALGWVASSWVSPERVREKVLAHLNEQFDGVEVHVGSARMRILGGIAVTDLRITRPGDPPDRPLLAVPSAVLYHDKEQLNRGRLVIRKVELENPELNLERSADGRWNLADVLKPGPADKPVPTIVAKGGTLSLTDRAPGGLPPLRLTDARFTLLNDPLPVLGLDVSATAGAFGPVHVRSRMNRVSRQLVVGLELP